MAGGEFLGTQYTQHENFEITYQQKEYAEHIRPITISKERSKKPWLPATDREIAALRAVNGALGWLSSQSRPDLAIQTSISQQAFPNPTVQHLLAANQAVRRARQQSDLEIRVPFIDPKDLTVCFWSDAAFANSSEHKTQAGWIMGLTSKEMSKGLDVPVHCIGWKSYKLPRVVASTLGGESQAFASASGIAEWTLLLVAEGLDGVFDLSEVSDVLQRRSPIGMTDCRSLFDHLISLGSGGPLDDKRTAIDVAIIRQSIQRAKLEPRWCPTGHMVADGLTKDKGEPLDLLRSVIRTARYQLADEDTVLDRKKVEREFRKNRAAVRDASSKREENPPPDIPLLWRERVATVIIPWNDFCVFRLAVCDWMSQVTLANFLSDVLCTALFASEDRTVIVNSSNFCFQHASFLHSWDSGWYSPEYLWFLFMSDPEWAAGSNLNAWDCRHRVPLCPFVVQWVCRRHLLLLCLLRKPAPLPICWLVCRMVVCHRQDIQNSLELWLMLPNVGSQSLILIWRRSLSMSAQRNLLSHPSLRSPSHLPVFRHLQPSCMCLWSMWETSQFLLTTPILKIGAQRCANFQRPCICTFPMQSL